jgi:hypothetical protein
MVYVLLLRAKAPNLWGLHKPIPSQGNTLEVLLLVVSGAVLPFCSLGRGRRYGVVNDTGILPILGGADLGRERLAHELARKLFKCLGLSIFAQRGGQHLSSLRL